MMDTKYYTPELSEFHVGFKYELKCLNTIDYNTRIYGDKVDTPLLNSDESIFESIEEELEDRDIRVKYLDKSDIESCGFYVSGDPNNINPIGEFEKEETKTSWIGISSWPKKVIRITRNVDTDSTGYVEDTTIFMGIIKNLSELKVLLKQLGIC